VRTPVEYHRFRSCTVHSQVEREVGLTGVEELALGSDGDTDDLTSGEGRTVVGEILDSGDGGLDGLGDKFRIAEGLGDGFHRHFIYSREKNISYK
jgi:hypothetical protein